MGTRGPDGAVPATFSAGRGRCITLADLDGEMVAEASAAVRHAEDAVRRVGLDLRYVGQEFTLPVPVDREDLVAADRQRIRTAFDALYDQRYAHHSPDEPVE